MLPAVPALGAEPGEPCLKVSAPGTGLAGSLAGREGRRMDGDSAPRRAVLLGAPLGRGGAGGPGALAGPHPDTAHSS